MPLAPYDVSAGPTSAAPAPRDRVLRARAADASSAPARPLPILAERPIGLICLPLIALALWVLTQAYQGIVGDASVYIGRALADLDPTGVGRDMMFVDDGQSRFSIVPLLLDRLVAAFGTNTTSLLLAYTSMLAWIAALAAFAGRYVQKPFIAIVVIFVAVLSTGYGAPLRFHFAEVLAVPRPLAEALVLAALAGLASGRTWLGFAALFLASLVHPLMALAGWAIFALVLSYEDRRWRFAFVAAAALILIGAAAGMPVLHRLFTAMDPDLKAFAEYRSPHLFPTLWPIGFVGPILAQAASLAIAASFVDGRRRLILIAAILAGIGGIAAQAIFADHFSLLLVVQVQLWRLAWITAALGGAALAFCALALWRDGPRSHAVLALLALAWLTPTTPIPAGLFAGSALALHFLGRRRDLPFTWTGAAFMWGIACLVALVLNIHYLAGYIDFIARLPPAAPRSGRYFWVERYVAFPILGLVLVLAFTRKSRLAAGVLALAAFCLCVAAFGSWDDRSAFQKMIDAGKHPPTLAQAIASRPGEILWVDGLAEAWYLAGRPQWASPEQGVSTIFSATLAHDWRARMRFLIAEGLAAKNGIATIKTASTADLPRLTKANVTHLCARPDAPAWIVAPVNKDTIIPPGLGTHEWHLPQPNFRMTEEPHNYAWHRIDAYAILACAHDAPKQR
ncbi:hypothetical protein [Methylovirgula sp. HY1]|uniref:hypothetical protein n=1 Tax=Methylovirgula sp. HY1 TaxID=2822761 RepID=UPI001C5BD756|nr:hypothetical protein [Methylovirgula sp. HY1]